MPNVEDVSTMTPTSTVETTPSATADYSQISQDGTKATTGTNVGATDTTRPAQSNVMKTNDITTATTNVIPTYSTVEAQRPSDFMDDTVNQYYADYQNNSQVQNYIGQINALKGIDEYRVQNGYQPIYTNTILKLNNEREKEITSKISDYQYLIGQYTEAGDLTTANQLKEELRQYANSVGKRLPAVGNGLSESDFLATTPQFESVYRDSIDEILNQIRTEYTTFNYDPNSDMDLKMAMDYAINTVTNTQAERGLLDSTMTQAVISSTVNRLIMQFRDQRFNEFEKSYERLKSVASLLLDMDNQAFKRYTENLDQALSYYTSLRKESEFQWDRVEQLGYVDNPASRVLGVPVGTLAPSVRKANEEQQRKLDLIEANLTADKELARFKNDLTTISTNVYGFDGSSFNGSLSETALREQIQLEMNKYGKTDIADFDFSNEKDVEEYNNLVNMCAKYAKDFTTFTNALNGTWSRDDGYTYSLGDLGSALNSVLAREKQDRLAKSPEYNEAFEHLTDILDNSSGYAQYLKSASNYFGNYTTKHDLVNRNAEAYTTLMEQFLPIYETDANGNAVFDNQGERIVIGGYTGNDYINNKTPSKNLY